MATRPNDNHNGTPAGRADPADPEDAAWFRELFDATYTPLVAYARRRAGDLAEADDIVAEVFTTVWRRRDEGGLGRPVPSPPLPWLYGIAANVIRNHRRSTVRRFRLVDRLGAQPTRDQADPADLTAGGLRDALARLSLDDQELLRLIAWEGLSHAEIGVVLGVSTNAVGVRAHRARKRLEAELATGLDPERPDEKEGTT